MQTCSSSEGGARYCFSCIAARLRYMIGEAFAFLPFASNFFATLKNSTKQRSLTQAVAATANFFEQIVAHGTPIASRGTSVG
jgi:hypothetical protein